jgi:transposase-like protein
MGSINKYCPHCGSEEIWEFHIELSNSLYEFEDPQVFYYECSDCHSTWEPHRIIGAENVDG